MVEFYGSSVPVFHCLMTSKKESLYTATFKKIKEMCPAFTPSTFMADYEKGLNNALKAVFEGSTVSGCRFHFTQSIYRKILNLGLSTIYKENEEFRHWCLQIMTLVMLPAHHIAPLFQSLQQQAFDSLTAAETKQIHLFKKYIQRYWIQQVGPQQMSVFACDKKTNNSLEAYNRHIKMRFRKAHPNMWQFLSTLNGIIRISVTEIMRLKRGLQISRDKTRESRRLEKTIKSLENKFLSDKITAKQYLIALSYQVNPRIEESEIDPEQLEEEEEDNFSSDEPNQNHSLCVVCMDPSKARNAVIIPCHHANACYDCCIRIKHQISNNSCPICHGTIEDILKIFQ